MTKLRAEQWAGAAGILTGVMFFASALVLPLSDFPASDSTPAAVADWVKQYRGEVIAGILLNAVGSGAMVIWLAGMRDHLADAWSRFGFSAGVLTVAIFTTGFAALIAAAYRVDTADPATVQAFSDFAWATFAISSVPTIFSFVLYAVSIFESKRLPAWLAWAGLVTSLLHVGAVLSVAGSSGLLSLQGDFNIWVPASAYLWVLAGGIALLRSRPVEDRS